MSSTRSGNRLDSIDALRGLAALSVALYHVWGHFGQYPWPSIGIVTQTPNAPLLSYLTSPLRWGYLGVGLFLVLSGFCIHLPYARRQTAGSYGFEARTFYLRRLWRLYPAYFISVTGTFVVLLISANRFGGAGGAPRLADLISHLTLTHGLFDRYFYGLVHVYWSLALEFQLYLAYPLFLLLFRKFGTGKSLMLLTAISLVWRYLALTYWGSNLISVSASGPFTAMGSVFARMPEWLAGAWLAELYVSGAVRKVRRPQLVLLSAILFGVSIMVTLYDPLWILVDGLFGLSFASLVAAAVHSPAQATVRSGLYGRLVWLGTISYTVYLFHMQLSWPLTNLLSSVPGYGFPFVLRLALLGVSIPILGVIYRFVEAPFLRAPRSGEPFYATYSRIEAFLGIKREEVPVAGIQPAVQ
jgi:peptidoglycan/LPS O-acetylase OafA/YrhL